MEELLECPDDIFNSNVSALVDRLNELLASGVDDYSIRTRSIELYTDFRHAAPGRHYAIYTNDPNRLRVILESTARDFIKAGNLDLEATITAMCEQLSGHHDDGEVRICITRKAPRDISSHSASPDKATSLTLHRMEYGMYNPFDSTTHLTEIFRQADADCCYDAIEEHLNHPDHDGAIYVIRLDHQIIGITGWFAIDHDAAALRWCGILPEHRQHGHMRAALILLASEIPRRYQNIYEGALTEGGFNYFMNCGLGFEAMPEEEVPPTLVDDGDYAYYCRSNLDQLSKRKLYV